MNWKYPNPLILGSTSDLPLPVGSHSSPRQPAVNSTHAPPARSALFSHSAHSLPFLLAVRYQLLDVHQKAVLTQKISESDCSRSVLFCTCQSVCEYMDIVKSPVLFLSIIVFGCGGTDCVILTCLTCACHNALLNSSWRLLEDQENQMYCYLVALAINYITIANFVCHFYCTILIFSLLLRILYRYIRNFIYLIFSSFPYFSPQYIPFHLHSLFYNSPTSVSAAHLFTGVEQFTGA